jgi:ferredoxin
MGQSMFSLSRSEGMKLLILYFSGTGNTDYVSHYLARRLDYLPAEIEIGSIERMRADSLGRFDLLALGFPVYACEAPRLLLEYIDSMEPGAGRGVFVFCTKGAFAGNSVLKTLDRLQRRGYVSLGGASVAMPGSDGLPFMAVDSWPVRAAVKKDYDHLRKADHLARRMADIISKLSAGHSVDCFRRAPRPHLSGVLLGWLFSAAYRWFEERLRQRFWVDETCVGCGKCSRICPTVNIELQAGHPRFGNRCQLCMRCIHSCPQGAIQIGKGTVNKFRWHGPKGRFDPLLMRSESTTRNRSSEVRNSL